MSNQNTELGITALGTDIDTAYQILSTVTYAEVATSTDTNYCVKLPFPLFGKTYTIKNLGNSRIYIFPPNNTSFIDNQLAGDSFVIYPNTTISLSNTQINGNIVNFSSSHFQSNLSLIPVSGNSTIENIDSGVTILVSVGPSDFTITLPAPTTIVKIKFLLKSNAVTNSATIEAGAGLCSGVTLTTSGVAGDCVFHSQQAGQSIAFNAHALPGDYLNFQSDGTKWMYDGMSGGAIVGFTYV